MRLCYFFIKAGEYFGNNNIVKDFIFRTDIEQQPAHAKDISIEVNFIFQKDNVFAYDLPVIIEKARII